MFQRVFKKTVTLVTKRKAFLIVTSVSLLLGRPAFADAELTMGWGEGTLPGWKGLFVMNTGDEPILIKSIELNGRSECQLLALDPAKNDLSALGKVDIGWVYMSATLALDNPHTLFLPEQLMTGSGAISYDVTVQVGESIGIMKHLDCPTVVRATIETDSGPIEIKFDKPYTQPDR
ncbi:hypothetical protein [Mesorhizobium sp.]|uniref:hypothetical protein n=1 Tax=Mesorhizobium sp. TaxID=1871066 RepID=UPI000FE42CA0|nr:hypothetical protein [Mesorhizobium sp.]RWH69170.1 MAG: hypothetical protein EOQ84_23840 [Mesorhizobium sp.]RWL24482.1 MAG: hypothetical protein EOR63_30230 [Mesorhizobium sp.]RWL26943.1 MAG: hypothetical protein EOR58_17005 [Mesorhizobium sp.]RWL38068.1 MAG: hypothetical protein EOR59_15690 [Mesorhizobium sp.]RWL56830.1 MAG: hypothetical protein EOR62_05435 [Mesorhizobium sp.]